MEYKELLIIKHSLKQYIQRSNAKKNDIAEEEKLLRKIENQIADLKQQYGIR
ncbi:hypothetical protein NYE24_30665 [Paenibacillus sp. FSL H7-0350]|uniref:hypothetical protein n=1 Tax=Paenibacillus sp. FSL H7-0350 TaxID=2975345 RepID=UPI0031590889